MRTLLREFGRIRVRLLVVNLLVLLVPVVGLEFARLYESQLLGALERDMRNQAVLTRRMLEADLARDVAIGDPEQERLLFRAAIDTRTRIRVFDASREVVLDSHREGPPEGPEPSPPSLSFSRRAQSSASWTPPSERWPAAAERDEVRRAFRGERASRTRVRARAPAVLLFLTEPVMVDRAVVGVVYVVRSTQPVLYELYRIRQGLVWVLAVAVAFAALLSLLLALSISRPLARLSRAARLIAAGEPDVVVPVGGGGEIAELGESVATMRAELDRRMHFVSEFAADVAHEFKSPLTSIRGAAELLVEGAADDPDARARFLRNIELDVDRLDRLVSRLLELSRIEATRGEWARADLPGLVHGVASRVATPEHAVDVRIALGARAPEAWVRVHELETALRNLCDNAIRFSPADAPIDLSLEGVEGGYLFRVRDRGPGVPARNRDRIFQRFFTTDEERDGTGLGLAIVTAVAAAHGGHVALEPTPPNTVEDAGAESKGASFSLYIPTRSAPASASRAG